MTLIKAKFVARVNKVYKRIQKIVISSALFRFFLGFVAFWAYFVTFTNWDASIIAVSQSFRRNKSYLIEKCRSVY